MKSLFESQKKNQSQVEYCGASVNKHSNGVTATINKHSNATDNYCGASVNKHSNGVTSIN